MGPIFESIRKRHLRHVVKHYVRNEQPIPLNIYARCLDEGIDLEELERTIRNG